MNSSENAIRTLIVDDEELGRKNLYYALGEHADWHVVAQASNVANARLVLATEEIDVIFLDIQMPRESGLDLARELASKEKPPLIIFITAFNEHAIEAFDLHALDYLLKPLDDHRLQLALERASTMLQLKQQATYAKSLRAYANSEAVLTTKQTNDYWQFISVRSIGSIERIALEDVFWIEAQGNYMQLHLKDKKTLYRASMSLLEKHLDPAIFLRIHRSTIIRKDQIIKMQVMPDNSYKMALRCGNQVLVSERYISAVKNWINA
ncbi:LytR/AlgR family response regulator transcription factor [Undibacterium sp. SXout11W]|uniref:LytR/AlgR family response regulator transcription factor n=1 Tax=Undibacterium sp. SXout11W TaxID=3413050 RepID=UPI003BEFBC4A